MAMRCVALSARADLVVRPVGIGDRIGGRDRWRPGPVARAVGDRPAPRAPSPGGMPFLAGRSRGYVAAGGPVPEAGGGVGYPLQHRSNRVT